MSGFQVSKESAGSEKSKPTQRSISKEGPRVGIISGVIDLGIQPQMYEGEKQRDCREFLPIITLVNDKYKDDDGVEHCMVTSPWPIKLKLGERSNYTKFCKAVDPRGEVLEDGVGDISQLIGRPCFAVMAHTQGKGDASDITYSNCKGVQELPEDFHPTGVDINEVVFDTSNPDKEVFDKLWDRTQALITSSIGWEGFGERVQPGGVTPAKEGFEDFDDKVPF